MGFHGCKQAQGVPIYRNTFFVCRMTWGYLHDRHDLKMKYWERVSPAVVYFRLHAAFFQKTGDTCQVYAKKFRKKFGEYRFELGIRPKYAENDANLPIWKPLLRCNSPAIYPQNWFSSVPTFCYPGVAFCSKTAILGPGSGSERGVIYAPDSRFWAQICGGKSKRWCVKSQATLRVFFENSCRKVFDERRSTEG